MRQPLREEILRRFMKGESINSIWTGPIGLTREQIEQVIRDALAGKIKIP